MFQQAQQVPQGTLSPQPSFSTHAGVCSVSRSLNLHLSLVRACSPEPCYSWSLQEVSDMGCQAVLGAGVSPDLDLPGSPSHPHPTYSLSTPFVSPVESQVYVNQLQV